MADSRFSNKRGAGSLARRILLISLCLLVFPLFIYIIYDLQDNYRSRLRDLFLSLDSLGQGQERLLEEFLFVESRSLDTLTLFFDFSQPSSNSGVQFKDVRDSEQFSSLFFLASDENGNRCTFSSDPAMVGLSNLFLPQLNAVSSGKGRAFLGINPITMRKEVYVAKFVNVTSEENQGVLISGFDAEKVITQLSMLEGVLYSFQTTLLNENGEPFLSSDPNFSLSNVHLLLTGDDIEREDANFLYFANVEEKSSFLNLFTKSDAKIGLKLPVQGATFYLLVDLSEQSAFDISRHELFFRYAVLFFLLFVIGGSLSWWLMKRMARPLKALSIKMERVGEGHLSSRYEKDSLGFEINLLGAQFNSMVEGLSNYIEEIRNIKIGRELLLNELKIGHQIQKRIFPNELPDVEGLQIAAGFIPAQQITGDFYDLFVDSSNNLIITLGDAAGKGIPASIYALILRSLLRSAFYTLDVPLDQIIERINLLFCRDTQDSGYFATAWLGKLDLKSRELDFTSCGHLPGLLVRKNGRIEELLVSGTALGVEEKIDVTVKTVSLSTGDLLLLYSDGILEAHDKEQNLFGKERLREVIADGHELTCELLIAHIFKEIELFSAGAPQHDDLMLLAIRMK